MPAASQFHGDVALIMIDGHDAIEFPSIGTDKQGITWPRPRNIDASSLCRQYRRCNDGLLLIPKQAAVTGMWVEGGHCDTGRMRLQAGKHSVE